MAGGFQTSNTAPRGWWRGTASEAATPQSLACALGRVHQPLFVLDDAIASDGAVTLGAGEPPPGCRPLLAHAPAVLPEQLGDPWFRRDHGLRFNYVAGAMAGGIASADLVEAMARAGLLGVFGAAGLDLADVETAIDRLTTRLFDRPWAANLIHSPFEPELEAAVADLYIRKGVRRVSASAYLDLTLPLVRYRTAGVHAGPDGQPIAPNHLIAKVSRVEVARKFLSAPPAAMVRELVARGDLTEAQADLTPGLAVATDLTVEADSGGHTDNRPALALVPTMIALRDRLQVDGAAPIRIGAAGGIGTPHAAAAAFAMGAAYVVTGTINQATREAGTSDAVRSMLAEAGQADVAMAPAADMFEMGVKLQVLRRGTMFAMRAQKLWDLYRAHPSLEALPEADRATLERSVFRMPLERAWSQTRDYWAQRDPAQVARAEQDPHHRMALTFRWYLGMASRWANTGVADRTVDYQVWCGPAIGAFNEWARGSLFEGPQHRRVVPIAYNILHGACVLARAAALRNQGVQLPPRSVDVRPREPAELEEFAL